MIIKSAQTWTNTERIHQTFIKLADRQETKWQHDVWLWCLCVLEQLRPVVELGPLILRSCSCSWSSSWADDLRPGDRSSVVSVSCNSNRITTCDCFGTWWEREFLVQHWFKIFLYPQTQFPRHLWETLGSSVLHLTSIHHRNTLEATKQLIKVINDK